MIIKLQQFIFKKLNQKIITSKVSGIYYQVTSNSYFPYIYVGDFNSKDISTKDREYAEITFSINIYFRDKNLKQMLEVAELIKQLLSRVEIYIKYSDEKILQQLDGITQQIIITFKAKLVGEVYV
jgi:hypothetical protein